MAQRSASANVSLTGRRGLYRYSRHLLIPEVGLAGQERLAASRVLVVGAGGLGSPALQYLAAAGVGRIGIVDFDTVDETNLQRQTIFSNDDVGRGKAAAAAARVNALNPEVAVDAIPLRLDAGNARELIGLYDVVLDCTDRFSSRYLINDACVLESKPDVYGSIFRFDGQVSVFAPGGPCYRCLYPHAPPAGTVPSCAEGGVLGVLAGIVGSWQAAEALKLLLQVGQPLSGRLMLIDALSARVREIAFEADPLCAVCGAEATIDSITPQAYAEPDEDDGDLAGLGVREIDAGELDGALENARLLDVREPHEAVLGTIDGAVAIPAAQLEARMHELDTAQPYVVACRVGAASLWAVRRLHAAGFRKLIHLRGGLLAYAAQRPEFESF